MIKTIKEIEIKQTIKTYFYDENNVLIAVEKDEEIITMRELTEEEQREIHRMI